MDQNSVFVFSKHFDGELLRRLFDGNLNHILILFEEWYQVIPDHLESIREDMASADWANAAAKVHQLKSSVRSLLKSNHPEELHQMEHRLYGILQPARSSDPVATAIEANKIKSDFHRIYFEILTARQHVHAEMDRIRIYLSHPQRRF